MSQHFSASLFQAPLSADAAEGLEVQRLRSLRVLLLTLCIITPGIVLALHLRGASTSIEAVAAGLWLACLAMLWQSHSRWSHTVPVTMVVVAMTAGILGVIADGSVRSSAMLVILAAVIGAGTYLSQRVMVASAVVAVCSLGILNFAQQEHWIQPSRLPGDWALWLTQTAVMICLLVMVYFGRSRLESAFEAQRRALMHWERVAGALQESEARFTSLFRNNPAATLVQRVDDGTVLEVNDAYVHMMGHPRGDLLGKTPPNMWQDEAQQLQFREALYAQGKVRGMAVRGLRANGEAFDCQLFAEFVEAGAEGLVITMLLDVSAEVAAREALRKSEERFSKAFNFSPLGMTITRISDGLFLEVNPANERVLGFTREDFMDRTSVEAGVWLSEADRIAYIEALRRNGRLMGYETRMRSKQGTPVDVRIWSERIELENEACNLAFTLNATEERRKTALLLNVAKGVSAQTGEAFFQSLVKQLAEAVGAHGVLVAETRPGAGLHSLALSCHGATMATDSRPIEGAPFARTLRSPGLWFTSLQPGEVPAVCPEPGLLKSFAGVALRDEDGTAVGLLGVFWRESVEPTEDMRALITIFSSRCNAELLRLHRDRELQRLQATLEQRVADRTAELELLNRELDTFAYSVSHDLKSPLRSIDGFMHLLQEQTASRSTPDDQVLMSRVMLSAQRMHGLINDLLGLARVSQTQLQRTEVNLSEIAADVVRQERHRDPEHQLTVNIEAGLITSCDARLAQIVLENLIGNAWKYSHKSAQPRIEFGRVPADRPEDVPMFFVRDNGAGFDMARADRLFKPFTRLHQPSEFQGSGIGLATVRRIIERHGGHISGEGAVGQGAEFRFWFGRSTGD
jgi:PAS domain S-box-containing protein